MKQTALLLIAAAAFTAGAAFAHTELSASMPDNGTTIAKAPENVELTFSAPVRLTALSVQKDGEKKQSLGPLPAATTEKFAVALPATIDEGHYVVAWRAMSADAHIMSGELMFAVGAPGTHEAHMSHVDVPAGAPQSPPAAQSAPAAAHGDAHGGAH